jgi:hypothetical protein
MDEKERKRKPQKNTVCTTIVIFTLYVPLFIANEERGFFIGMITTSQHE